jgi:hypothetical protein
MSADLGMRRASSVVSNLVFVLNGHTGVPPHPIVLRPSDPVDFRADRFLLFVLEINEGDARRLLRDVYGVCPVLDSDARPVPMGVDFEVVYFCELCGRRYGSFSQAASEAASKGVKAARQHRALYRRRNSHRRGCRQGYRHRTKHSGRTRRVEALGEDWAMLRGCRPRRTRARPGGRP